ncbi:phage tail tape measure protein [Pseudophaeobacter sp.]|uniref:phage tail tape measure protein n=1 Tax=Pseudophaeobacter sp. TaxID=1971739 RepID=UPI003279EBEE
MTDFARLGIAVDSRTAKTASNDLGHLAREGRKASDSADALTRSTNRTRDAHGRYVGQARKATQATGRFGDSAKAASSTVSAMGKAIGALAVGMAGIASAQLSVVQARGFQAALAETSTLISGTRAEMSLVEQEARRMAGTFGGTATDQVKAFYQAISAGADGVEAATQILDQSNKLAIGGVTDVTTGVDALTTAMNAFSATGLTAAEASDAMFVGMKAGKTTIAELAGQMGQIVPIASAAGVSFDEMIAGISALTTQGQSTAMATTGLRAAITGILQPSKQAADAAKSLGLEFSASALQAKGLEQFMAEIVQTTGGSTDALTQLFGSVEALNAVLAFSGAAGQTFTDIMSDMGNKAGATDTAYQKLTKGLDQKLNEVLGRLSNSVLSVGNSILTVAVPAMEAFASGVEFVAVHSDVLMVVMAGLAASAIPNMIASLGTLTGIMATTTAAATGLATAMWAATGPWGILAGLVAAAGAAYVVFGKETKTFQDTISELDAAQDTLNTQVAAFATTYAPAAGGAAIEAANDYLQLAKAAREAAAAQLAADTTEMARIRGMIDNGHLRNLTIEEEAKLSARLHGATSRLTVSQSAYDQALRARDETVHTVMSSDGQMVETTKRLNSAIEITVDGLGGVSKAAGKAAKGLKKVKTESEAFAEAMEKAAYTTEDFGTEKANTLISGIDGISGAWGDFVSRGFSDFKGFVDNILDSFKGMLSQMITMAARNRIMIGLGFGGVTGSAASASGLAGSSGGSGGGLLGGGGNLLSLGSSLFGTGGAVSGVWSGLSGVFSGGGLGSSFANLGGLASGASSGFGAIGAALPALGIIAVGIAAIASAFKNEYHGRAVRGALGPDGFDGYEFDFWDGGWLRGDTQRNYETGSELQSMLDDSSRAIRTNVEDMAAALGLGADAIADFTGEGFTIWLSGPSAGSQEQIAAALEAQLSALGEGMADLVLSTEAYTRSGESSYETMTRLGSSLITVNDAMDLLQVTAFNTSLAAADQASRLIDVFGGAEVMGSSILVYWNAFYSEAERQETTIRRLKDQFADLNLTMPETREEFRALVNGLDLRSESGAALYVELIGLSGAMGQILPQIGQLSETMTGLLNQINGELGSQVDIARGLASDSKQAASLWYRTATTLRDFLSGLLNSDLTSASHSQAHAVNRSRFDAAFGLARGGDVEAARDIPELAKAYLTSAQANASSSLEYRRIAAAVQGQVNFLAGISELEGANEDVLTGLYNQQIDVLTNLGNFLQLEGLTNDQVGELSAGVQALHADWDGTVGAFQSSLGALQDAITNAEAFSYDDLVGRLDVAVSLSDDAPSWVQRLVDRADTGIRTALDFVIRRNDLSAADRWIATNALSEHVASIDFVLRNDVDEDTRRLALRTDARIRRSIRLSLGRDLDQDTRTLVLTRAANLSRRVNVALTNGGDRTVRRLNRLQDLIGGSGSGNLTFDGGVQLTADSVFTDLVGSASGLVQPMDHLSNMLGELRQAVDSDRQQRELAALEAQGAALAANLAAKQVDASGIIDSIHALERATGTTLQNGGGDAVLRQLDGGGIAYRASHISSNHNVAAWQAQFWDDGGLEDQIFAVNAAIQGDREALRAWRRQIREAGGIPSYAGGGEQRRTGLAHIGENDLELVAPSRIYNPAETKAMLDNRELVKEIKALREEVSELRKDKHRTDYQKIKDQKESTGILRRMQVDGIKTKEAT